MNISLLDSKQIYNYATTSSNVFKKSAPILWKKYNNRDIRYLSNDYSKLYCAREYEELSLGSFSDIEIKFHCENLNALIFFDEALNLIFQGKADSALDTIFRELTKLMKKSDFIIIDYILKSVDPTPPSVDLCIALLSASLPVRSRLKNRTILFQKIHRQLRDLNEDADLELLGLD